MKLMSKTKEGPYYRIRGFNKSGIDFIWMPIFELGTSIRSVRSRARKLLSVAGYTCARATVLPMLKANAEYWKSIDPRTEIQLPDGRWVEAITYPQYDADKKYPERIPV